MSKWLISIVFIIVNCSSICLQSAAAQDARSYTPSKLLGTGQLEFKQFNNLYTQTAVFDNDGNKQDLDFRVTYFTGITNLLFGIDPRMNIGLDLYFRSVRIDEKSSSPFSLFKFSSGSDSRSALASIAPKIKLSPFSMVRTLALQTSLIIPVASNLEGDNDQPFLDYDDVQWWTQFFYDLPLSDRSLAYFEPSLLFRFDSSRTDFLTPFKAILNYFPARRWTIYLPVELIPTWDGASWNSYYSQTGLGGKYYLTSNIELEGLYSIFLVGKNNGAGQTFNLGIRIIGSPW
ncbi:MAG: hypothetical protein GTO51_08795 [Candidatus Latescibacteria bacterium]|nr:hypothetical protein [Candidatus Latescibacterota bacterium]NIM22049.1 hypothetical protein [Candidatus Latescibacterota bacterium]NIM66068.1 hypothetical protein [Candidatus Latescibacterota bacterium]NIO02476.1 hypothetical protein [Candidatus Latescibacterota bacterium]NIO29387.1 hypothetical protein [Candidatus Latescibacterota bacterium]